MLIVCFGDGLGNQMFQYAFYKELQKRYPSETVKMDIFNIYGSYIHNGFELEKLFGIKSNECTEEESLSLLEYCPIVNKKYWLRNKISRINDLLGRKKGTTFYQKDATEYYSEVFCLEKGQSMLFRGNWVNEKYFENVKQELKDIFVFPKIESKKNLNVLERIENSNSVSIHVRRGDYLQSGMHNLSLNYYKQAVKIIKEKLSYPQFYVFSDDSDFIRDNFDFIGDYLIVEGNKGENSWIDMFLMSKCKHNIIANSTFSFWGAYLNSNNSKIVIAPEMAAPQFKNPFACTEWMIIGDENK